MKKRNYKNKYNKISKQTTTNTSKTGSELRTQLMLHERILQESL